ADTPDASSGKRGRSGRACAWRRRLANLLARDLAQYQVGIVIRGDFVQRPGDGRIRRRLRGFRTYPRTDEYDSTARRDSLQRIQFGRRFRHGIAPDGADAGDARAQIVDRLEIEAKHHAQSRMDNPSLM